MTVLQVAELAHRATQDGYTTLYYRPYQYIENNALHTRYMLIMEVEGSEVAVMSEANYEIRRFDHIFD